MGHTNTTANYNLPQFLGTDKPGWLTDINTAFYDIDAQMKLNEDAADVLTIVDELFPVGSEYVTKTDVAPSFGGSWVLVDKELKDAKITIDPLYLTVPAGGDVGTVEASVSGHEIKLRISGLVANGLGDTTVTGITIDPAGLGLSQFSHQSTIFTGFSDTGNLLYCGSFSTAGALTFTDAFVISNPIAHSYSGSLSAIEISCVCESSYISDDTLCDRFIWERVS